MTLNKYNKNVDQGLVNHLYDLLLDLLNTRKYKTIKVICIGTDRSSGDSLGPLVGTLLNKKLNLEYVNILGTIDNPVHANNIKDIREDIKDDDLVIAIDAALTIEKAKIGKIGINLEPLKPGSGVGNDLPEIGAFNISAYLGLVCSDSYKNYLNLSNMNLNEVYNMASILSNILKCVFLKLDNYIKENVNSESRLELIGESRKEIISPFQKKQNIKLKENLVKNLSKKLTLLKTGIYKSIVIYNFGDAIGTGNSLGPLIGTTLTNNINHPSIEVFGTLKKPLIKENIPNIIRNIRPDDFVITTSSNLTLMNNEIGKVKISEKIDILDDDIYKQLLGISNINLIGLINFYTDSEVLRSQVIKNTRLAVVLNMVKVIAESLGETLPNYLPYLNNNDNSSLNKDLIKRR